MIRDEYYYEKLEDTVKKFIVKSPIPIVYNFYKDQPKFEIKHGGIRKVFDIDYGISYLDYLHLIEKQFYQYFPKFSCEVEVKRDYTEEEILNEIEKGASFEDVYGKQITEVRTDVGIIERVYIVHDQFRFNFNNKRMIRQSIKMPLSTLLKTLRHPDTINDHRKKRELILNSSIFVTDVKNKPIEIAYPPRQLLNFFKIYAEDMTNETLSLLQNNIYSWGRYNVKIDSRQLLDEIKVIISKEKQK
jgi:hypothetical protein